MNIYNDESKRLLKPFQCTICPKSFVHESSLEEHILTKHEDNKTFQCTECFTKRQLAKFFATQHILNKHLKRSHGPPRFKCPVCFRAFNNSSNFMKHKILHSQTIQKNHQCDICSKSFYFNHQLQTHLFNVHKQKRRDVPYLQCEFCFQEFLERSKLEIHVVRQHVVDKAFECPVCSKTFIDQETLEKHMKAHDRQITYFCDVCSKRFTMKKSLVQHLGVEHKKFFYCHKKCCRSFKNKPEFDEHISDSKQELKCYLCQETLNSECNLKIHMDSHVKEIEAEKIEIKVENQLEPIKLANEVMKQKSTTQKVLNSDNFHCELCSKNFDREAYFKAHRREVHPNAEWKCNFEQCSKTFKAYHLFRLHKMEHAESKDFACNICGKSFYRPDSLKDHEETHVEHKKFKCNTCPKSFGSPFKLRIHIGNNHGGPKPFKCPVTSCRTTWASTNELKYHLVSHITDRSFKCEICKTFKAFKSLKQLKYHQKTVHLGAKTNKTRKSRKRMDNQKYCEAVVFVCCSKMCSFQTVSETEVALHYNQQHQLPNLILSRNSFSSSPCELMVQKRESTSADRMIQKRFKCGVCSKLFKFPYLLSGHQSTHSNEIPFQCSWCSKSFKYKKNLNRHILETHS